MSAATGLRPFFSFYGSKYRAARLYPEPAHSTLIEPFAGSAGYALRYPDRAVVLVDADEYIVGIWSYLLGASERDILTLPDLRPDQSTDDLPIAQEAKWLIGMWINAGVSSPRKRMSSAARMPMAERIARWPGARALFWGEKVRQRIASQLPAIRHWRVIHSNYTGAPNITATWFVDPPYQGPAGSHYRLRVDDYNALAAWCRNQQGQVIVCEGDGAEWLPFKDMVAIRSNAMRTGRSWTRERVWLSSEAA